MMVNFLFPPPSPATDISTGLAPIANNPASIMNRKQHSIPTGHPKPRKEAPGEQAGRVAETSSGVDPEMIERRRDIRKLLRAAAWVAVGITAYAFLRWGPGMFSLKPGAAGSPAWGPIIAAVAINLLAALLLYLEPRAKASPGIDPDKLARQRDVRTWLVASVWAAVMLPIYFYVRWGADIFSLKHGAAGPLAWGCTIFIVTICLLVALGFGLDGRTEYDAKVPMRGDLADRVGACWLFSCAFGPCLGWVATAVLPITSGSWHWLYGVRVFLAAGLPILTALPLTRYARGKTALILLPLLAGVTLLPVWSAVNAARDLWSGPVARIIPSTGQQVWYLEHTEERFAP